MTKNLNYDQLIKMKFTFDDEYNRTWEIPVKAVVDDYVEFYKEQGEVFDETTLTESDIKIWFNEQWYGENIIKHGIITKDLTLEEYADIGKRRVNLYIDHIDGGCEFNYKLTK